MVFGNNTKGSIILDTMHSYAEEKNKGSDKHSVNDWLRDNYFGQEKNKEESEDLNTRVKDAIEKERGDGGSLTRLNKTSDGNKTIHHHKRGHLNQTKDGDNNFHFAPDEQFSGVLTVERIDANGDLIPGQKDIVEYKNGKPIAVSMAAKGKCRISGIGEIQKEVARNAVGITVSGKIKSTGIEVSSFSSQLSAPSTPKVSSNKSKNIRR